MKINIYNQGVLEGVDASFQQTEEVIDNIKVTGVTANDIQKILNLKHAWEFILDKDVIANKSDYYMLSHITKLINEGFLLREVVYVEFLLRLEVHHIYRHYHLKSMLKKIYERLLREMKM